MARVINFNPGPASLPLQALERAQRELLDYQGSGMSIMEHSHRGKDYEAVHNEAQTLLRSLLGIPETHQVLFLQGGASQQFALVPMNFLPSGKSADYVLTGAWGKKAFGEAKLVGSVRLAGSAEKDGTFVRLPTPSDLQFDPSAAYVHITTNETIHGVQFIQSFPDTQGVPMVADMSSDFLWRRFDVSRFSLVYAGAQKNVGPAGVTVVIARKDFVASGRTDIPKIFRYKTHADENSLSNTPPTFAIYMVRNVLLWVQDCGGLDQIEAWNRQKADLLYGFLDRNAHFYRAPVQPDSRSVMNIVFRLPTPELEAKFIQDAKSAGMVGLKGHRSVGGIRVSSYNAITVEAIRTLLDFMEKFQKTNG